VKDEEILKNVFILQIFLVDIFWILKWKSGIKRFYFTIRGEQVRRRSYSIPSRSDPLLLGWYDIQNRKYDICSVERRFLSKLAIFYKLPQNLDEMINMWTRCLYIFFSAVQYFSILHIVRGFQHMPIYIINIVWRSISFYYFKHSVLFIKKTICNEDKTNNIRHQSLKHF
jgi:hypothetical protein